MPVFHYTGRDAEGGLSSETLNAASFEEAQKILDARSVQYFNLIQEQSIPLLKWETVSQKNILFFTRYFAVLVKAGVTVFKALSILEKQERNAVFREKIKIIREDLESGQSLYKAFMRFSDMFGTFYCNLIRIGEETGKLFDTLERLAEYIEKSRDLRRKVISVIIYPALVSVMVILITLFLFTFIMPKFADLYWQLGLTKEDLPEITKLMIYVGNLLRDNLLWILAGSVLFTASIYEFYRTDQGRFIIDDSLLRFPLLNQIIIRYNLSIFCINLSMLFESGYTLLRSFDLAVGIVSNYSLRLQMNRIIRSLESGRGIAQSFREVSAIPILTTEMVEIGEETASFDKMLRYISDFYDRELDLLIKTFVSLIEPLLIMMLGGVVLVVLLSVYLPIFQLAAKIKV